MTPNKVFALIYFCLFSFLPCKAAITDSIFDIKDNNARLLAIVNKYHLLTFRSDSAILFKKEVIEKGNTSEKLIINWSYEVRCLPAADWGAHIKVFDKYIPLSAKNGDPLLLAIVYGLKADALYYSAKYNQAFENYLYAYQYLKQDTKELYFGMTWALYAISMNFYLFKDYNKTIEISHTISTLPPPKGFDPNWFKCNNYDLIGMAYFKKSQFDSASHWFNKAYLSALDKNDTAWIGITQGNLGWLYYKEGHYEKAIPLLQKGIQFCSIKHLWDNVAPFSACLADIYTNKKEFDEALKMLQLSLESNKKYYSINNKVEYFKVAALYEKARANYATAFEYIDSTNYYELLEVKEFEISKKVLSESRLAYEKQLMENDIMQQKAEKEKLLLYAMVAILSLSVVAAALFIKRQKLKHSLNEEILQNEKLRAENELSLALYEIKDFSHNISEKNRAIEQLLSKVKTLEDQKNEDVIKKSEPNNLVELTALRDEDWADFYVMFDKAFPGYQQKFRTKLPELNETELRYFMLLKIETAENEISGMLGIDNTEVEQMRAQLVEKLELTNKDEIEILLESI